MNEQGPASQEAVGCKHGQLFSSECPQCKQDHEHLQRKVDVLMQQERERILKDPLDDNMAFEEAVEETCPHGVWTPVDCDSCKEDARRKIETAKTTRDAELAQIEVDLDDRTSDRFTDLDGMRSETAYRVAQEQTQQTYESTIMDIHKRFWKLNEQAVQTQAQKPPRPNL